MANHYGVADLVLFKHELRSVCLKAFLYLADITLYRMGFRVELKGAKYLVTGKVLNNKYNVVQKV